ncbi:prepilin peptidase [Calycomorphotria hydatis]|uniref:Type 4 prepilin-like proteins leader peptide-processing enzyme n=1 Tax=Calycomorphotria hydatis TaxID=2528027 RepID=A0A517TAC0_9PLAN|nr:A24 family peptidase [Calycomorphotria hydatis]QDT65320.1 Type 4 prepilin-like proteins leader peptide-processing enzyme [Calycomorphotria hydatis]
MIENDLLRYGLAVVVFLVAASVGRFLNRCIDRFPRTEIFKDQINAAIRPNTHDWRMWSFLKWYHHLPVIGRWLPGNPYRVQHTSAELRRTTVELLNGLLCAAVFLVDTQAPPTALTPDVATALPNTAWRMISLCIAHWVLIQALIVASVIDLETMLIPDGSTVPATIFGLVWALLCGQSMLVPLWFYDSTMLYLLGIGDADLFTQAGIVVPDWQSNWPHLHALAGAICGMIVGAGIVWLVRVIGHAALGKEAMGFGDVILMGMIGTFLGWQPVLVVFFVAPLCALVATLAFAATGFWRHIPYGHWLSIAAVIVLLAWPYVWPPAERVFLMGPLLFPFAFMLFGTLAVLLLAMRLLKKILGIRDELPYWEVNTWGSGDQLQYEASRREQPNRLIDSTVPNYGQRRWGQY